jgi:hypothetical protein
MERRSLIRSAIARVRLDVVKLRNSAGTLPPGLVLRGERQPQVSVSLR